uniref:Synaptopodin 2 n=1 Tax=Haplochromis burtoni TaxID=8153 RepID=A0A3Q2V153_HAPBU
MGTGDYICVTLRGGAPWGFTLREGEGDTYRPLLVSQGGRASLAGVQDGDEVVSINGEPCADLTLLQAFAMPAAELRSYETCTLESTTLHIFPQKQTSQIPNPESPDETYSKEFNINTEYSKEGQLLCTQLHIPSSKEEDDKVQRCFSPGDMVELQVSLSEQTLDDVGCASLGSARGIDGDLSNREAVEAVEAVHITNAATASRSVREPLSHHGVVLNSPLMLGQVEVILEASGVGRGLQSGGGTRVRETVGSQSEGEEEDCSPAEEQESDSEGVQHKPNKHRARHARLRRNESISEKQLKEAKSKCKRIALLLTAAPTNPNNKGLLMFKKHRQRAKKFTLVSYGTGEDEPEYSDEEYEENPDSRQETSAPQFILVAPNDSDIDKPFLTSTHSGKSVLTFTLDKGLLEIERNLKNQAEMESLPETKGKGALMFVQRRQRMDEISAEHEELRRQGIPVEAVQEAEKKIVEHSYMQSEQQKMQQYSATVNGTVQHQTNEMQSSFSNRTAKPFSADNMAATPYSHAMSGTNQDSVSQGEQIASRDERISTPAIRTGLLLDSRKKNAAKPMFTFKEAPKVSPNPALLNLLNKGDKKPGFESGPEDDYLSLGAEACNFLQSQRVKHKIPPPVAPKPPQTPVNAWTPQSQQKPVNISTLTVNTRPSPKPWQPPQNVPQSRSPPTPPQRMLSFTIGQRVSSPINPMATVLNPSSQGSAFEMPAVKGKGADMFAKRQSRMEKYIVDSETVEANKASRSTSPAASLPNEWKYTPNVRAPPPRAYNPIQSPFYPPAATKQPPSSSPSTKAKKKDKAKQMPAPKPLNVIDVMKHQPYQLNSSLFIYGPAAEATKPSAPKTTPQKTGSQTWSQSRSPSRASLPSFVSPVRSSISTTVSHAGYRSLPRQWQPQKSVTEANPRPSVSSYESKSPFGKQTYKSVYTSNTWSWRR